MAFTRKKDFTGWSREDLVKSATERLYRSVSASEQSTARLKDKLTSVGYPLDVVDEVVEHAVELGIVDDVRYCECLIRSTVSAGKGLSKVEREVSALGIDMESLDSYQEYMERGEDAMIDDAVDLLQRRPPKAKDMYAACFRKLLTKGFSSSVASRATRRFCDMSRDGGSSL